MRTLICFNGAVLENTGPRIYVSKHNFNIKFADIRLVDAFIFNVRTMVSSPMLANRLDVLKSKMTCGNLTFLNSGNRKMVLFRPEGTCIRKFQMKNKQILRYVLCKWQADVF